MCWSSNGTNEGWYRGSRGTALIKVAPKSLLAVKADDQWLKVYYQRVGEILCCPLGIQGPMRLTSSLISINAIISLAKLMKHWKSSQWHESPVRECGVR
jgi:hypothetical protein